MKKLLQFLTLALFVLTNLNVKAQNWSLTGNAGTNSATNFIGTKDYKALIFRTNNIEGMRLSKLGSLGIGTTTPQAKLNVDGGLFVSLSSPGYLILGNTTAYNMALDYNVIQSRYNGVANDLFLNYYGGNTYIGQSGSFGLHIAPNGTAGIHGSSNPAYALNINASSSINGINVTDPGNNYAFYCTMSGGAGEGLRMNISSTTNPYSAIRGHTDGIGEGVLGESTATGIGVEGYSSQGIGLWAGTGNSSSWAGYFSGTVYATTYQSSDQKLKQNIQDFSSAMNIINQLHPKQYQYRQDGNYKLMNLPQGQHYGLIAQDVEKVLPNLVKGAKFNADKAVPSNPVDTKNSSAQKLKSSEIIDFKTLNYTELIPIIIKGMQEQQDIITQQQQQINELKQMMQSIPGNSSTTLAQTFIEANLQQNSPNPFTQNTLIRCFVPSYVNQAQLVVYGADGKPLKTFSLSNNGMNSIKINANTLSSGKYTYSLFIDGRQVDSKSMMLTK